MKTAEADELKAKNEELMAENTRLSDLTRMLLSSPAFSTFLSDLSGNGVAPPPSSSQVSQPATVKAGPTPNTRKDVNPHNVIKREAESRQQVAQIGMTLIPETNIDYSALESTSNPWVEGAMDFGLYDAQVFTITELPQGPAVDQISPAILSGKSTYSATSFVDDDENEAKHELPSMERRPVPEKTEPAQELERGRDDVEFDESDPAFTLFANCSSHTASIATNAEPRLFGNIETDKAFSRLELVTDQHEDDGLGEVSTATMQNFERLCSRLEAASNRIDALMPHQ